MRQHFNRAIVGTVFFAFLSSSTLPGCKRNNKSPLLTEPGAGVTSVSMAIRAIDNTQTPFMKAVMQVVDSSNNRITDFKIGNFSVLEDNKPGVPVEVGRETDPVFSVAFVIDRSGSMAGFVPSGITLTEAANLAAADGVRALGANDRAALIEFESSARLAVPFTTDKATVINTILSGEPSGGTAFFDGVVLAATELMKQPGVKFLIALGDGDDNSSANTLLTTIAALSGRGIIAYTIGLGTGISSTGQDDYRRVAVGSGGSFFTSSDGAGLSSTYQNIINGVAFQDLVYVKYRRRSFGPVTVYLNYGSLTASAKVEVSN